MSTKQGLAILSGLALILPMMQLNAFAVYPAGPYRAPTMISLDFIDQCINSMTCNAEIFTGTTIKFTGTLTDSNGNPLPDKSVDIVALIPTPALVVLATNTTDIDGKFSAEWVAKLSTQTTPMQDVTRKFRAESDTIFAQFNGDDTMAPSKSNKIVMSVTVNTVHTTINSDKTQYNANETATVFIAFVDSADKFIDPDSISATLNNEPVTLEKKKEGSYTFIITDLPRKHQQLIVVPHKEGWNTYVAFLTIIVAGLR